MKKNLKIIFVILLSLGLATGILFYVRYQMRLFNTIKFLVQKNAMLENFMVLNFPDQVKTFNESLNAK